MNGHGLLAFMAVSSIQRIGGGDWISQTNPQGITADFSGVFFLNAKSGLGPWAATLSFIRQTAVINWSVQSFNPDFVLNKITFADNSNGWAVGNGGVILYTCGWRKFVESAQYPGLRNTFKAFHLLIHLMGWGCVAYPGRYFIRLMRVSHGFCRTQIYQGFIQCAIPE